MNHVVLMLYFLNSLSMRGTPTSPANIPLVISLGESSPPYDPSLRGSVNLRSLRGVEGTDQPLTASTSTPIEQRALLGALVGAVGSDISSDKSRVKGPQAGSAGV